MCNFFLTLTNLNSLAYTAGDNPFCNGDIAFAVKAGVVRVDDFTRLP